MDDAWEGSGEVEEGKDGDAADRGMEEVQAAFGVQVKGISGELPAGDETPLLCTRLRRENVLDGTVHGGCNDFVIRISLR